MAWTPADEDAVDGWIRSNAQDPDIGALYRGSLVMRLWTVECAFQEVQGAASILTAEAFVGADESEACEGLWGFDTDLVDQNACIDWFATVDGEEGGRPFGWLLDRALALRDAACGMPRRRYPRIELPDLIAAGEQLMSEAAEMPLGRPAATRFRNGLLVSLLGWRCVRLANIHALSLVEMPGCGWLDLSTKPGRMCWSASLMKDRSPWQTELPAAVRPSIDAYLTRYRPVLLRGADHDQFWVSGESGAPLSYGQVEEAFKSATKCVFGHAIPPHRVRHINAVYVAETMPDRMWVASGLLGHADPASRRHYDAMARQRQACRQAMSIIEAQASAGKCRK